MTIRNYAQAISQARSKGEADHLLELARGIYDMSALTLQEFEDAARAHAAFSETVKPRVFILEEANKDIHDATRFGDIEVLFPPDQFRPSIWEESISNEVEKRFRACHFDPVIDSVLLVGPQVLAVAAIAHLAQTYNEYRVLFWHASAKEYVPRVFKRKHHESEGAGGPQGSSSGTRTIAERHSRS